MSLSQVASLDVQICLAEIRELNPINRGHNKSAERYLSALKKECEEHKLAWQVYRTVRIEAKRCGLIPQ